MHAKAWTQAWFNPWSLSIEQIGRAAQTEWARDELREAARWIARWSRLYNIPAYKGKVDPVSGKILKAGVVRHSDLGVRGGGTTIRGAATRSLRRWRWPGSIAARSSEVRASLGCGETARDLLEEMVELWRLIPEWVKPYKH